MDIIKIRLAKFAKRNPISNPFPPVARPSFAPVVRAEFTANPKSEQIQIQVLGGDVQSGDLFPSLS